LNRAAESPGATLAEGLSDDPLMSDDRMRKPSDRQ